MINKQANILFIPTSIGGYCAERQGALSQHEYFQQSIYALLARSISTIEGFHILGRQLAEIARRAYLTKHMDAVEQATKVMLALPIADQLEGIAQYYQALCTWRRGDLNTARKSLERVVEEGTPQYRARALQIIGLTCQKRGEVDAALPFYIAAGKAAANCDLLTLAESQRMTAIVRSIHGDHEQALADLDKLFPLVRAIAKQYPVLYYDFLNSLAVELGEVGRLNEAQAACKIALGSPFAPAYPEWSETRDEIAAKRTSASRSVVAINRAPEADPSPHVEPQRHPESSRALAFVCPASNKDSFQRSIIPIPATATTAFNAVSILDRVLSCIGPRAPPGRL